jgi:peptidoglycan/LPS O-acetylase OafA/YrhL
MSAGQTSGLEGCEAAPADGRRLANLDLLRLLAAMMVLVYHLTYTGQAVGGANPVAYPELFPIVNQGWSGVSLFFMISGFVIAYSASHSDPLRFARSRFLRLYPAYLFCMTLTALVIVLVARSPMLEFQMSFQKWLANTTMLSQLFRQPFVDGVYWSVVVELVFYGWVAVLMLAGIFNHRQRLILFSWIALICFNELWFKSNVLNRVFLTQHGCFFILGIMAYRLLMRRIFDWRLDLPILLIAMALTVVSDMRMIEWMHKNYSPAPEQNVELSLLRTSLFVVLLAAGVRLAPLLSPARCMVIGGLTYPLYLLHANISFVLFQRLNGTMNRWALLTLITSLMLALAYVVYRFVEPPLRAAFAAALDWSMAWVGRRLPSGYPGASARREARSR